jgi:hypothetical protein
LALGLHNLAGTSLEISTKEQQMKVKSNLKAGQSSAAILD